MKKLTFKKLWKYEIRTLVFDGKFFLIVSVWNLYTSQEETSHRQKNFACAQAMAVTGRICDRWVPVTGKKNLPVHRQWLWQAESVTGECLWQAKKSACAQAMAVHRQCLWQVISVTGEKNLPVHRHCLWHVMAVTGKTCDRICHLCLSQAPVFATLVYCIT